MIVCERCKEALWSRGEVKRCSTVDEERLKELDIQVLWGFRNDDGEFVESEEYDDEQFCECQFCGEFESLEYVKEI